MLNESEVKRDRRGVSKGFKLPKGLRPNRVKASPPIAPIEHITEDYNTIKKDNKRKMSETTLKYLKDTKAISGDQFAIYSISKDLPEDREVISEKNIIEHLNLKLIEFYEKT